MIFRHGADQIFILRSFPNCIVKRWYSLTLVLFLACASSATSAYGHGLGQDQASPVTVGEKQVTVSAFIRPASVPFPQSDRPSLLIRTHDANSNITISGIDYRIIIEVRNQTLLDQRFRSSDGIFLANLVPDKDVDGWQMAGHESARPEDQIEVSQNNPVELRSGILVTGGLYHIRAIVEKTSGGISLVDNLEFELFVSVSHSFSFRADTPNGERDIVVKTYYDDVSDFSYQNATISFKMPFNWDPVYVSQVSLVHMEVQFPKSIEELKTNSYNGTLNGIDLRAESIQIDDYSSEENRVVHFVVSNDRLSRLANSVEIGTNIAIFSLAPAERPKFPLDLLSAPGEKYLFQLSWGPEVIETGLPTIFVMNLQDPGTGDLARRSSFDFVLTQDGKQIYSNSLSSDFGTYSLQYTFSNPGTVTLSAANINGQGESARIDLVVLQGTNPPVEPPPPSGCLIATAAFGSELTPQVQYLRNFRDQYIMSTVSGSAFMSTFNTIYYTFSPQVADYERQQPWLQSMVRAGLYPLFGILAAAERVHSMIGGEVGAVLAGITASSLIGSSYFLPAGILASKKVNARIVLVIFASCGLFLAVTMLMLPSLLPLSTPAFVLATTWTSGIMTAKAITRSRKQ